MPKKNLSAVEKSVFIVIFMAFSLFTISGHAQTESETGQIRWDLTDLYETEEAWRTRLEEIREEISQLPELKGTVSEDSESLAAGLQKISDIRKELYRIYIYASLGSDEDQRDTDGQARMGTVQALSTEFGESVAWLEPELLTIEAATLEAWIAEDPGLSAFDFYLEDLMRNAPHTLDEQGESLLASVSNVLGAPNKIYELLVNADVPWPVVELSTGERVMLNQAGYVKNRSAANREDRKLVFDTFWSMWGDYQDSLGAILNTEVQANVFAAKARNYPSVLSQQLGQENLPEEVYRTLVEEVNNSLPVLHRYFRLRARILGIEEMGYHDIYPPLVQMDTDFGIEASKDITLEVLESLGEEYMQHLEEGVNADWQHVYPQQGKRSGAYMNGSAYDVHPYILLNHNDDFNALSTYAHEWGHAVHTMLANEEQPFEKARYSTFTAEIAAIINEVLIEEYLIEQAETPEEKLFYLGQSLEALRGTFYRQTMFAEFELKIHETVEAGEPLTGAKLSEIYGDLLKRYHDHEGGTVNIEDAYTMEWAYIPHFYYDFYVFQYSTSISGATWFAEQLLAGNTDVRDAFIDMLKAGGSDYPYELLKEAGLDMASPDPYRATIRRMEDIMDRIEALL